MGIKAMDEYFGLDQGEQSEGLNKEIKKIIDNVNKRKTDALAVKTAILEVSNIIDRDVIEYTGKTIEG